MIKNKKIAFAIYVVVFMVFWNILDFLYATLITHSGYTFGAGTDMLIPLCLSIVSGYLFFLKD